MPTNRQSNPPGAPNGIGSGELLSGGQYFCVVDPAGIFVHTTLSLTHDEAVKQWVETEQSMNFIVNAGRLLRGESLRCAPSWEHFEAQGFKCLRVKLEVINANNS